jgi:hypothetical protein
LILTVLRAHRREQKPADDRRVKSLEEHDMMVPPMGTVLTSDGAQAARTDLSRGVEAPVVVACLDAADLLT